MITSGDGSSKGHNEQMPPLLLTILNYTRTTRNGDEVLSNINFLGFYLQYYECITH